MTGNAHFGIEIEMTGITREKAAKTIAEFFHTESRYVGGTYYAYEITDSMGQGLEGHAGFEHSPPAEDG